MFELAVAAFRPGQVPPVLFELPDEVTNFHVGIIGACSVRWKPHNVGVDAAARFNSSIAAPIILRKTLLIERVTTLLAMMRNLRHEKQSS